ncbi:uncharacterized protein LTR77_008303 [Saxophila tyrrhenica]|uniref:Pre-rRNA-processing protein RIX1 n=1 Tax=Saxophila tyrrhenica TaxID=1690608 RepID=A0AAV9P0J4_9PEZI|nr:hypothetical protein LTR77_008303 [Saxophila tyrrhenica]
MTSSSAANATLRAVTYRITSATPEQLPLLATQLAGSLWNCREILSAPADSKNDATALVHRLRTKITSILQDRTIEGRWAAVVLVKATIEAGGVDFLSKSNAWVRSLLAILKRPDPSTTRCLAVIALTRIFTLTWDYSNLVREITTPALPGFISTCLANIKKERCPSTELNTVLEAFATLLPRHPTIFRTHEPQIEAVLNEVLSSGPTGPTLHHSQKLIGTAQRVRVLLHHCAPKQGAGEQWDRTFQATVRAVHTTCDRLFRGVNEDWGAVGGTHKSTDRAIFSANEAGLDSQDEASFGPWTGIFAGRDRLVNLVGILQSHLQTTTASAVALRVGSLIDAITRLMGTTTVSGLAGAKVNAEVSREEREALSTVIPNVHVATMSLVHALLRRLGYASASYAQSISELIVEVYRAEHFDDELKKAAYGCQSSLLRLFGPSLPRENIAELTSMIQGCCGDMMQSDASASHADGKLAGSQPVALKQAAISQHRDGLLTAANRLVSTFVTEVNPAFVPRKLRTQIERTAVLTRSKDVLLACVLNPARKEVGGRLQTSLVPLLAKEYPDTREVEAMLRPRLPPVVVQNPGGFEDADMDASDEGEPSEELSPAANGTNGHHPADDLLSALIQPSNPTSDREEQEELYSTTPPPQVEGSAQSAMTTGQTEAKKIVTPAKRAADPTSADLEASVKRRRGSPVAEAIAGGPASALPGPDAAAMKADVPVTVAAGQAQAVNGEDATVVAPSALNVPTQGIQESAAGAGPEGDVGSDDSDFEMPPLTMEPDTDPEDDEEAE